MNNLADWLSVNDHDDLTGDGYLTNVPLQNNGRSSRNTSYKVRKGANNLERTVTVNQAGRPLYVQFVGSPYSPGATDTSVLIHGKTNASTLNFAIQESSGVFITLDSSGYKMYSGSEAIGNYITFGNGPANDPGADGEWEFCLEVTFAANTTLSSRTNHVVVTASAAGETSVTATAEITQGAGDAYLELSVGSSGEHSSSGVTIAFNYDGTLATGTASADVYVWSNGTWEVTSGS